MGVSQEKRDRLGDRALAGAIGGLRCSRLSQMVPRVPGVYFGHSRGDFTSICPGAQGRARGRPKGGDTMGEAVGEG